MKRPLLLLTALLIPHLLSAAPMLPAGQKVELSGLLTLKTFQDTHGEKEEQFVLILEAPVDVAADKQGAAAKGVKELQTLIFHNRWADKEKLIGKKIKVTGWLFHAHTAHHYTPVILEVEENEFRTITILP